MSAICVGNEDGWVIRDPGTGTYNGPLAVRNGFRASTAHPVWQPAGVDQMVPHRAFRWLRSVRGFAADPRLKPGRTVLFGWHDAFESQTGLGRLARAVVVTDGGVLVKDFVEHQSCMPPLHLTVPLPPGGTLDQLFGLEDARVTEGQRDPFAGWYSPTYGDWRPAKWLLLEGRAEDLPEWGAGNRPAGMELGISWGSEVVTLEVSAGGSTERLEARRG